MMDPMVTNDCLYVNIIENFTLDMFGSIVVFFKKLVLRYFLKSDFLKN
jgi:hypothetical protein